MAEGFDKMEEPDDYMIDYIPYTKGKRNDYDSSTIRFIKMNSVRDPERQQKFEEKVKKWLRKFIMSNFPDDTVIIAIAPSSKAFTKTSFMYDLIEEFIDEYDSDLDIKNGSDMLERYKTIPEQKYIPRYKRRESTHRNSIRISSSVSRLSRRKNVVILDDVYSSGCTLRVCKELMLKTNPKNVKIVAIGKTV